MKNLKNNIIALSFSLCTLALSTGYALAQEQSAGDGSGANPVEISAAGSLEWDKSQRSYTAKKDVIIKQGEIEIKCDSLSATYDNGKEITNIKVLEALGNVRISSPPYNAFGDKATYDVTSGKAVLTGKSVTVTTEKDVLVAEDRLEFSSNEKKITAFGHPIVKHDKDTISANTMAAYFKKDTNGKMISDKMMAKGNVHIKTATENISGDNLIFNSQTRQAVMSGNVIIEKDKSYIKGHKAVVDMNTGISQLLSDDKAEQSDGARVKGVFYPKSEGKQQ